MQKQGPERVILQRVLAAYGLGAAKAGPPQKGYRNTSYCLTLPGGEQRNLIFYKSEPGMLERIRRTNAVSDFAAAAGLPARRSRGKIMELKSPSRTRYAALYTYLPGNTIAWEAYTKHHLKELGKHLGLLHTVLAAYPGRRAAHHGRLPAVTDEYSAILARMEAYFQNPDVHQAMQQKLHLQPNSAAFKRCQTLLHACARMPGRQALHMDFVRGNILFESTAAGSQGNANKDESPQRRGTESDKTQRERPRITGILDFEKTAYGHPLVDLARTLAFLYVDCKYKTPAEVRRYFLRSGYLKRGGRQLPSATYPLLEQLVSLFLLHDFYKFLRHNPYESLTQNEHFLRTKDILIARKLVE